MRLEISRYVSTLWRQVTDIRTAVDAIRDLAQKLEQLARDLKAIDPFPSGVILFWLGDAASIPAGWSEVVELRGLFPRGMLEGGTPGSTGGSDTHSHSMNHSHTGAADLGGAHLHTITSDGSHSHSINSDGSHSHTLGQTVGGVQGGTSFNALTSITGMGSAGSHSHGGTNSGGGHSHGGLTDGGFPAGSHSHALTINPLAASTGTGSNLPAHLNGIWIRKD